MPKKPTHLHQQAPIVVDDKSDDDIIDAEVIEEDEPGTELEVAQVPFVPLPERLLLDQLGADWKWRKYRLPVDERIKRVEATLLTITAGNPQYNQPLGRDIDHKWPHCPSYSELWPRPIGEQLETRFTEAVGHLGRPFKTGDVVQVTAQGEHVKVGEDQIATEKFPRIAELLGETSVE